MEGGIRNRGEEGRLQEWSTERQVGFMNMKGQEEGGRRRNNTFFFYQACSLTDDIKNREDSLHAL